MSADQAEEADQEAGRLSKERVRQVGERRGVLGRGGLTVEACLRGEDKRTLNLEHFA